MIVTVEEAKTKRCQEAYPAAASLSDDGSGTNGMSHAVAYSVGVGMGGAGGMGHVVTQPPSGGAPRFCIGPECMAWKWSVGWSDYGVKQHMTLDGNALGYCGKAHR